MNRIIRWPMPNEMTLAAVIRYSDRLVYFIQAKASFSANSTEKLQLLHSAVKTPLRLKLIKASPPQMQRDFPI